MHVISNIRKLQDARNSHWCKIFMIILDGILWFLDVGKVQQKEQKLLPFHRCISDWCQDSCGDSTQMQMATTAYLMQRKLKNSCVIVKQDEIVVLFSRTICPSALHCIASRHCCNAYRKSMTLFDVSQPAVSYYMAYRQKKHQKKKGDLLTQGAQYIKKALKRINWNNLGRVLWNRH